jgi:hypothetical protein
LIRKGVTGLSKVRIILGKKKDFEEHDQLNETSMIIQ